MKSIRNDPVDWSEPPLKKWLGTIMRCGTKAVYKSAFRAYAKYTGLTATKLIDEAIEDFKKDPRQRQDIVKTRLVGFYQWLKNEYQVKRRGKGTHDPTRKGISDKLAHTWIGAIRSFYSTYDIYVKLRGRTKLPKPRVTNKRMLVSPVEVKRLIQHARSPRDRAIILTMFQSGMDVSTLCSLKHGDVAQGLEANEHPLKLDLYRGKSGMDYYSFLGRDAIEALRAYLNDLEMKKLKLDYNTPLFLKGSHKARSLEGLTTNLVQNMLKAVAMKAGFVDENLNGKAFNPLSPHALRESFGSIMINKGVPDTIVDFWLGHSIGEIDQAYKGMQAEELKRMYVEREIYISVTAPSRDIKEIEEKVENELRATKLELDLQKDRVIRLYEMVERLKGRMARYEAFTKKFMEMTPDELEEVGKAVERKRKERILREADEPMEAGSA